VAGLRAASYPTPGWLAAGTTPDGTAYHLQEHATGRPAGPSAHRRPGGGAGRGAGAARRPGAGFKRRHQPGVLAETIRRLHGLAGALADPGHRSA
jgi:hypothetical protein